MRLWHYKLLPVLPRQQLLGQWRECCCIVKKLSTNGTPNHLLVNKILDFPPNHFYRYCQLVAEEMIKRGYKVGNSYSNLSASFDKFSDCYWMSIEGELFSEWHNKRYLRQCYYNLQEKYDCGGISEAEWKTIDELVRSKYGQYIY